MNYKEIKQKLENLGQEHLLRFYEELNEEEKDILLNEINSIDFEACDINYRSGQSDNISPIRAMTVKEIERQKEAFYAAGIEALKNCRVAAVLLAGGQGTRLGFDGPKGTLNIGLTRERYIFQMHIEALKKVSEDAGRPVPLLIMTSEINDKATRSFFEAHDYFGYDKNSVFFFVQEMAPATDWDGKVYLKSKGHVALSPNGNGGWFRSLKRAGLLEKIKAMGVEWLNVFAVDNVLQKIADPYFAGATILSGYPVGAKVIRKAAPDEKVGVMCLRDGHPSIVEYIDLTEELMEAKDENGERLYNFGVILNYLFRLDALEEIADKNLPLHVVNKKIAHIDEEGNEINPSEPNGHKFEQLVLDMIEMMDNCLVYEVIREEEFAPIKNAHGVDSLDSAREMLVRQGYEL